MENQGYEEEQLRVEEEQSAFESRYRDQQSRDTIDRNDPIIARTHLETHVYENVSTDTAAVSKISERISFPDETCETKNRQSAELTKQAWINESSLITATAILDKSFQQNSTLNYSVNISANHNSAISSSQSVSETNEDDLEGVSKNSCDLSQSLPDGNTLESMSSSPREKEDSSRDASMQTDRKRANRRRKKKDCKHCRSKLAVANSCEKLDELIGGKDAILRENKINHQNKDPGLTSSLLFRESLLRSQNIKIYPIVKKTNLGDIGAKNFSTTFFENELRSNAENAARFLINDRMLDKVSESNQNKILGVSRNGTDMRINSIYSQDRWLGNGKESPIFYTEVKDQNPFQRAYSLPARTHTPTSQNRVNLRRSVRNEPPPHPARLDKHRRGWTLHLAGPLKASGCSNPLVPLLIVVLILLGVAGVALYIVFEPEKLQIIQQYLKSSKLTEQNVTSGEPITSVIPNDEPDLIATTRTTMTMNVDAFTMAAFLNSDASFPANVSSSTGVETETMSRNINATRYCDDCLEGEEVCVALVDEEVPTCKNPRDREDPTGCAGFCVINKQKCHRLDVDAFRCVEIEHYCLDNEWTCSNTLCIPLNKRCDGHMNCYDHSDEYDCVCNMETHFQCGNETSCLPLERRCDGKIDCWDATDEINCTLGRNLDWSCLLDNEFTCSNGECILKARFCDGLSDCSDGSDEPHGCQGRCNKHEFTCQNGRCITKDMKCNGIDDCGDGTDERHCKDRFT